MNLLLTNGRILNQEGALIEVDIWIKDTVIHAIGKNFSNEGCQFDQVIDVQKNLITPGLIDVHVHLREPGYEYKETIKTGSLAAAKGGFTSICAMPNVNPVPDTPKHLEDIYKKIAQDAVVRVYQYAPITEKLRSENLVDFKALKEAGAFAFTNDGVGVQTAGTMYLAMQQAVANQMSIVAHTEDESLLFGGVMHKGKKSEELNLPGIVAATESSQIARDVVLAGETGVHYHVCHVSSKESVRVIRDAKKAGINVTAEVCPHHLILDENDIPEDHGYYKMNPPLRATEDRLALIEGLLDGTIDCIATDHAPHSYEEKNQTMLRAPFGITGSETAFSLLYTHFVETGIFTLKQLVDWLTIKPARLFNMEASSLEVGSVADLAVFDLETEEVIMKESFLSKSENTPFTGQKVKGTTLYTIVDGNIVWQKTGDEK